MSACESAIKAAAEVDEMADTVTDLDPAIETCASLAEFASFAASYPTALDGADPRTFVGNRCREASLASTTLCREIAPSSAPDVTALAASSCADTTYSTCVADFLNMYSRAPGELIVICEYNAGTGDIALIDSESQAADECSGGGLISPSRVVAVVQLPP
jgi:hypothetical protein